MKTSPWDGFAPTGLDAESAREFDRLAAQLVRLGVADRTDPRVVVAAARTHALIEKAYAEVAAGDGKLTQVAANGTLMPHPMVSVLNTLTMRLKSLWAEMGLTPASSKLTNREVDAGEADPWDGLLNVHAG